MPLVSPPTRPTLRAQGRCDVVNMHIGSDSKYPAKPDFVCWSFAVGNKVLLYAFGNKAFLIATKHRFSKLPSPSQIKSEQDKRPCLFLVDFPPYKVYHTLSITENPFSRQLSPTYRPFQEDDETPNIPYPSAELSVPWILPRPLFSISECRSFASIANLPFTIKPWLSLIASWSTIR
jgi:hypothetical protein